MTWAAWEEQLTADAAREDAEKLFQSLSRVFHNVFFYHLLYPNFKLLAYEELQRIEFAEKFLEQLLNALGFSRFNFRELLALSTANVYAYLVSDFASYSLAAEDAELLTSWSRVLRLMYPIFPSSVLPKKASEKRVEINVYSDEVLSAAVSPRFTIALRMLHIRRRIAGYFSTPVVLDAQGNPVEFTPAPLETLSEELAALVEEHQSVSAPDLAFLAGVSYQYITKLVRAGKLPARKRGKFIFIPVKVAVAFAASRPTAPRWVKTLASRADISPLDTSSTPFE
jgi:hypothetical protein